VSFHLQRHLRLFPSSPQRFTFATLAHKPPPLKSHPKASTDTFLDSSTFSTSTTRQRTYIARAHHHVLTAPLRLSLESKRLLQAWLTPPTRASRAAPHPRTASPLPFKIAPRRLQFHPHLRKSHERSRDSPWRNTLPGKSRRLLPHTPAPPSQRTAPSRPLKGPRRSTGVGHKNAHTPRLMPSTLRWKKA
jgi:hypothetical protein